jgi:hypothetical protein
LNDRGYRILSECLSKNECAELGEILSNGLVARTRAGARHLMAHRSVSALANDARLVEHAKEWLGANAIPFRATLFEKSSETNWLIPWRQDRALPMSEGFERAGWGPWSEKGGVRYAHAPGWALARVIALRVHVMDRSAWFQARTLQESGVPTRLWRSFRRMRRSSAACRVEALSRCGLY